MWAKKKKKNAQQFEFSKHEESNSMIAIFKKI